MKLMFDNQESVANWIASKADAKFSNILGTIGVLSDEGLLVGAAVLHDWTRNDVELSYFGKGTLTLGICRAIGWIAFVRGGVQRLTLFIPRRKKRLLRAMSKLGFKHEGIKRRSFGPHKGDDAIMFGMLKSETGKYLEKWNEGTKAA